VEPVEPIAPSAPEEPSEPATVAEENTLATPLPVTEEPVLTPTIVIDDKPSVQFSEFDAVFDSDHPENSDLVYYPKDDDEKSIPDLEILEGTGVPLTEEDDVDNLDKKESEVEGIESLEYEDLGA